MARPKKEINWDIVEKKMEAGCTAREICANVCEINTFYDRFKEKYGKSFGDYADDYYSVGDGNIKFTQYIKALSGNIQMLSWLGKTRLGQREPDMLSAIPANQDNIDKDQLIMQLQHKLSQLENNADKSQTE
jgi:hypothetical protein